ncbi:hypothetical protein [Curtobacterium sp. VKM Ac-1376]|uniref:hypothetical protein n=1 Tax=Curtobacterium sp. VKM Ac-1376 TaxID=123312 RepID=UPI00188C3CE1|nr:hypothetical protein [Curtobacterium sp. VKM Ac-1376]MBF4615331.1 hypothetical protein [Curtobacterium sp. VKM Ac-1376]
MQLLVTSVPGGIIALTAFIVGLATGTAFGPLGTRRDTPTAISMGAAFQDANTLTDWRVWSWLRRAFASGSARNQTEGNPPANLFIVGVVVVVLVQLYARHRDTVAVVVVLATLGMLATVTLSFAALWWKEVVEGRATAWRFLVSVALVAVGLYDGVSLVHPAFDGNAVTDLLAHGVFASGGASFGTVLYQAAGACMALAIAVVSVFYCMASITAVYITAGAFGRPLWRLLYWASRWTVPGWVGWVALFIGALSVVMTNGLLAHLLATLQSDA